MSPTKILLTLCSFFILLQSYAQQDLTITVRQSGNNHPLAGATVTLSPGRKTTAADSTGYVHFASLQPGKYSVAVSYAGFKPQVVTLSLPLTNLPFEVLLEAGEEEEEVIVTATRAIRSINDIPTRVEIISGEELTEKGNMKPGDIRMLLNETTGIQTQQTSATSYNSSIRIQGLDGRYTQLLRDGFPLYTGFSAGLSLMQIAPLDLKQVEVIKGSSSTLYGGGAIAGLVNLVSKTPGDESELSLIANGTSAKGLDLSGFFSKKFNHTGITVFGSRNSTTAYDPADIGLTAIPKSSRYTINPRFFFYGNKTRANVGISYITEDRIGGSIGYIKFNQPGYFEENKTGRLTTQAELNHKLNESSSITVKNSFTDFSRKIISRYSSFDARQQSSYTEVNVNTSKEQIFWTGGINFLTDALKEEPMQLGAVRDYSYNTFGAFLQNTWSPGEKISLETGLRTDYIKEFGLEILPRFAVMYKPNSKLTSRLGGGLGYKTPSIFSELAEKMLYQNILPVDPAWASNEKSVGVNFDINYRIQAGPVSVTMNQLFFYTRINKPVLLFLTANNNYVFHNADGFIETKGIETNLRFSVDAFKLFIGYTLADVSSRLYDARRSLPLTPKHRLNNVLMYEKEDKLKIGIEAYYFSPQHLSDRTTGKSYWIFGFMAEKLWEKFSLFINFENFTDTRQSKFDSIFTGAPDNPIFKDIYAPVDGFVINGGFKIRLKGI